MKITNNDQSFSRNRRLMRVAKFYYDWMQCLGYGCERGSTAAFAGPAMKPATPLLGLHDHKGNLDVTWGGTPTEVERAAIETAWVHAGEESRENVSHIVEEASHAV